MKRSPLRRVSNRRAAENRIYARERKKYLEEHPMCEACLDRPSVELHHKRSRIGRLLCDVRFFFATCSVCHAWIHDNPRKARELGWLSSTREWNTVPESACGGA